MFEKMLLCDPTPGKLLNIEGVTAITVHEGAFTYKSSAGVGTTVPPFPKAEKSIQAEAKTYC